MSTTKRTRTPKFLVERARSRRPKLRRSQLVQEPDEEYLSIEEAVSVLSQNRIKGLSNRESVRRALRDKRIPSVRANAPGSPYRIPAAAIRALVANQPPVDTNAPSVHKRLLEHYASDPLHNPVTAVMEGVVKDIGEATRLYRLFKKHQPDLQALGEKRALSAWREKKAKEAAARPSCAKCKRDDFVARQESAGVVAAVTGRLDPYLRNAGFRDQEQEALTEFNGEWRCRACGMWQAGAPIAAMRNKLGSVGAGPGAEPRAVLDELLAQALRDLSGKES